MNASKESVITSPNDAAIGVATLSGLTPNFLESKITKIITRPKQKFIFLILCTQIFTVYVLTK